MTIYEIKSDTSGTHLIEAAIQLFSIYVFPLILFFNDTNLVQAYFIATNYSNVVGDISYDPLPTFSSRNPDMQTHFINKY